MTQPHPYDQQPGQSQQPVPAHPGFAAYPGQPQQSGPPHPGYATHPGQPQYPGQLQQPGSHGPTPPAAKPRKPLWKRWWFWVLAVIVLFIIIANAGGGDESTADSNAAADSAEAATTDDDAEDSPDAGDDEGEASAEDSDASGSDYGIGDAVATGDWEVTVTDVKSGVNEVGSEFLNSTAQGQFILVEISVSNTGSSPSYFFDGDVKLKDDDGNTYASDSEAGIYAASDNEILFLEEINPGNTAAGVLVFDVPADVAPNVLEFQGGLFDTPASVAVD